jgi:hydrogenase-4 component F
MIISLLLLPFVAGLLCLVLPLKQLRHIVLVLAALANLILVTVLYVNRATTPIGIWFGADALGLLFLFITAILFVIVTPPVLNYLKNNPDTGHPRLLTEPFFICFFLFFLGAMNTVLVSQHTGMFWVAIEATTLTSAPLICYLITNRSLEATWKYLLICSVGIAMALLGNIALTVSLPVVANVSEHLLTYTYLTNHATTLNPFWLKIAFAFIFIGYGTKMGLAPLHTWLPDDHSEAPSPIAAVLSGALLNCAFLGILRMLIILEKAGMGSYANGLLILFGLASLFLAGGMILRAFDYKRLLAYSSIEHMGILAVAVGAGAASRYGAFLHAINHSLAKSLLFLTAGMILSRRKTKSIKDVQGLLKSDPLIAFFWMTGALAIVGLPPFGTFISELSIMAGLGQEQHWVLLALLLFALALVFLGLFKAFIPMIYGEPAVLSATKSKISPLELTPLLLILMLVILGIHIPEPVQNLIVAAVNQMGGM